jgi:hypothetical protein
MVRLPTGNDPKAFFGRERQRLGREFSLSAPVVCERFAVYRAPAKCGLTFPLQPTCYGWRLEPNARRRQWSNGLPAAR